MIAFWSLVDIEPDGLPGFERSVTIHLNGGIVSEDILAGMNRWWSGGCSKPRHLTLVQFRETKDVVKRLALEMGQ